MWNASLHYFVRVLTIFATFAFVDATIYAVTRLLEFVKASSEQFWGTNSKYFLSVNNTTIYSVSGNYSTATKNH